MNRTKKVEWIRLDNASKIFPATCNDKDTKVFRLACELTETVEPAILQQALNATIERFPLYKSVLKRGIFWYYFDTSDIQPVVENDENPVCAPIYRKDIRNLLFRTSYYKNRINLEVFHVLSDGTGALWFMKTLVYHYLFIKHKNKFSGKLPELNYYASISEKMDDSFIRYYPGKDYNMAKTREHKRVALPKAYNIRGIRLEENRIKVIEGVMSAKAVLQEVHKYNTTLTIFLASLLIHSIYQEIPVRSKRHPIILSVPINLRQFFESVTARNFFSTMNIGYCFKEDKASLDDVIKSISEDFKRELTEERLIQHLNWFIALERNLFTRIVPLPLKDFFLRIGHKITSRKTTSSISNIGRISMPSEFDKYIRQFIVIPNANKPQIAICTYGDRLVVTFASPFRETEIQRNFFKSLSTMNIEIEISSNT